MTIPNLLTLFRIIAIPFLVIFFYMPVGFNHILVAGLFALAAITDWLDGYLARYWHQTSPLGEFLDPVADKLIVAVALVLLVGKLPYLSIPAAIIVGREIVISALREWMAELGKRASLAVSYVGKIKTLIQMLSVMFLLLYKPGINEYIGIVGYCLIYIAAIMTLWSMFMYLRAAWPQISISLNINISSKP